MRGFYSQFRSDTDWKDVIVNFSEMEIYWVLYRIDSSEADQFGALTFFVLNSRGSLLSKAKQLLYEYILIENLWTLFRLRSLGLKFQSSAITLQIVVRDQQTHSCDDDM